MKNGRRRNEVRKMKKGSKEDEGRKRGKTKEWRKTLEGKKEERKMNE